MKPEILGEKPISLAHSRQELERIKKRDGELSFRGNKTEEYLNQFGTLETRKAEEIYQKIEALKIPRLRDIHIIKIIDILPGSLNEMRTLLQGYTLTLKEDAMKKILDVLKDYNKVIASRVNNQDEVAGKK